MSIHQQINFVGKLREDDGAKMFFIAEKQQKTNLKFSKDTLNVTERYKQWSIKKYWIYWMNQAIPNLWQENGTLSMINQMWIIL